MYLEEQGAYFEMFLKPTVLHLIAWSGCDQLMDPGM